MGCCASTDEGGATGSSDTKPASAPEKASTTPEGTKESKKPAPTTAKGESKAMEQTSEVDDGNRASYIPKEAKGAKAFLPETAELDTKGDISSPAPVPTSQSSGPKAVRGWAPPSKEWDKETKSKQDKTRFEIKEEWDEDGNLVRTTIKKTITPDWKWKTEKTVDIIPAAEAAKMKK